MLQLQLVVAVVVLYLLELVEINMVHQEDLVVAEVTIVEQDLVVHQALMVLQEINQTKILVTLDL